jgi:hypothetical protein
MKITPRTFFAVVFVSPAAARVPERNDAALTSPADLSQLLRLIEAATGSFGCMVNP